MSLMNSNPDPDTKIDIGVTEADAQDKVKKLDGWFIDGVKRLSAESRNPRYAMKGSGFLRDVRELIKSERSDEAYLVAYAKYIAKYLEKMFWIEPSDIGKSGNKGNGSEEIVGKSNGEESEESDGDGSEAGIFIDGALAAFNTVLEMIGFCEEDGRPADYDMIRSGVEALIDQWDKVAEVVGGDGDTKN